MDNEIERLQRAKMYMDYLTNGVDPVSNMDADTNTLQNEKVIACFRYVSGVLERNIYEAKSVTKHSNSDFYITESQCAELKVYPYNCKVSELANEINRVTKINGTKKMSAAWINNWLESEGYLCQSDLKSRISTDKGKQLGITSEYRQRDNGNEYYINFYPEQAQRFIYDHISEINAYENKQHSKTEIMIKSVDFPSELSVREFIMQNSDKCFIISIGSCDSVSNAGSYITVLLYKGRSMVMKKTNIPTNSANRCILTGITEAASAIRLPTDVIILSSTPLGFNTTRSPNYRLCQEIYQILTKKECRISESVCHGKGAELNSFIKSLSG